jgi:methyl-accepting chemotaxis protein
MFKRLKLSTKIISGFVGISLIILIVGLLGYQGLNKIALKQKDLVESVPLIDAAMEMKIAVISDMLMLMDMLSAQEKDELEKIWKEHEGFAGSFDKFADAILNGATTPEGTIYPAKKEELKSIVRSADKFHNEEFSVRIKKIYNLMLEDISAKKESEIVMEKFEKGFDKIIDLAESLEEKIKDRIKSRIRSGASVTEVLKKENAWVDIAMEIKTTLAMSRIAIEEYSQSNKAGEMAKVKNRYDSTLKQFDSEINSLLKGAQTDHGYVPPMNITELKNLVKTMDENHDSLFQNNASLFIQTRNKILDINKEIEVLDHEADEIGGKMLTLLGGVEKGANDEIKLSLKESDAVNSSSKTMSMICVFVGLISALIMGFVISRSITKPINVIIENLNEGAEQVLSAATQVSSSSQSLAEGASEQAASIEETSSSMEEMSSMTKNNAANADQSNNLMKEANLVVSKSNNSMKALITSMEEISKASAETSMIIKTIDEIAFQTNLLALNAAVEAARAGEAGAGFAVVADEVRNLAMRAADAAKNTSELIEGTVKKVNEGSNLVTNTNDSFLQVAGSTGKVGELVGEISVASLEQADGIEQINKAIAEMDKIVQQNAAGAEEAASASEEMNAQALQMKSVVNNLIEIVEGSGNVQVKQHQTQTPNLMVQKKVLRRKKAPQNLEIKPSQVIPMDDDFSDF